MLDWNTQMIPSPMLARLGLIFIYFINSLPLLMFWSDSSLSLCFASCWRKSTGLWTTEAEGFYPWRPPRSSLKREQKENAAFKDRDQLWSILGLCVFVFGCVLVLATYRVPKSAFYQQNEEIFAGPHNFKGVFEGWTLVLRLGLALVKVRVGVGG